MPEVHADERPARHYRWPTILIPLTILLWACTFVTSFLEVPPATPAPPTPEPVLPETGGTPLPPLPTPQPTASRPPQRDPEATLTIYWTQFPRATVVQMANVRVCASTECAIERTLAPGDWVYVLGRSEDDPDWVRVRSEAWDGELYMHQSTLTAGAPLP